MLSGDVMTMPETGIWKTQVKMTVVGGKIVYRNDEVSVLLWSAPAWCACADAGSVPSRSRRVPLDSVHRAAGPTEVDCRFEVVKGDATVHMELLPMSEFRRFNRGREHDTLAVSDDAAVGGVSGASWNPRQIHGGGDNNSGARPALVSLEVRTDLNPNADVVAKVLPPGRRLAVILISFAIFFVTITWSGIKLVRAIRP